MRNPVLLTSAALVLCAPLAACATGAPAYQAPTAASYGSVGFAPPVEPGQAEDGLLPEPPANAKAGQCFAKVVVPGQPVYGPPTLQSHMRWVQTPPQPGTIGPVWCQVWEQGYQPTMSYTPERYGWIRVICDHDATADKIGHIQHRLHDWGYYNGGYGGQYDQSTAQAVKRFQSDRHIEHGGYLSYKTMDMLEAPPPPVRPPVIARPSAPMMAAPLNSPPLYAENAWGGEYTQQSYGQQVYSQDNYTQQTFQQPLPVIAGPPQVLAPIYQQGAPAQQPIYAQPQYVQPQYAQPEYAQPQLAPPLFNSAQFAQAQYGQMQFGHAQFSPAPCPSACQAPIVQPCGAAPCQTQGGYGQRAVGYQGRWLNWSGKSGY